MIYLVCFQNDLLLGLLQQITESCSEGGDQIAVNSQPSDSQTAADNVEIKSEVVGPTTEELESFNELIQFDHVYYKPAASQSKGSVGSVPASAKKTPSKRAAVSIIKPAVRAVAQGQPAQETVVVKEEPQEELSLGEADLAGLSQTLEELIDLDALLKEDLMADSQNPPSPVAMDAASLTSVDKPGSRKRKHEPTQVEELCANKKKSSLSVDTAYFQDSFSSNDSSLFPGIDSFGLDSSLSPVKSSSVSESGYSSDLSDMGSPKSDISGDMGGDALWEESFSELFPSLI